jgi:hypothetical protein
MRLALFLALLACPLLLLGDGPSDDIPLLGHESYEVREAAQARLIKATPRPWVGTEYVDNFTVIDQLMSARRHATDPEALWRLAVILEITPWMSQAYRDTKPEAAK